MTLYRRLSLFTKPTVKNIFIDTSAILALLDVESEDPQAKQEADAYERYFTEFLPDCNCVALINPLVWLEIIQRIDYLTMEKYWDGDEGTSAKGMRKEYTEQHVHYESKGIIQKIRRDQKKWTSLMSRMIRASGKISCARWPGDSKTISFAKDITKDIRETWMKNFSTADVFHFYFMKRFNIRVAVSQDKHFLDVPDIRVHRFDRA